MVGWMGWEGWNCWGGLVRFVCRSFYFALFPSLSGRYTKVMLYTYLHLFAPSYAPLDEWGKKKKLSIYVPYNENFESPIRSSDKPSNLIPSFLLLDPSRLATPRHPWLNLIFHSF
ncbi:hypothetical protein L873DRAFT_830470 [Choiromyces venosus 120613-1]|uniref:Uncharacterized protein n=1 Tax=Choiromyces venosus 120613-1 TaxID=1336337 RepID=A0A3N4JPE7_9PEZI|nr:hypothetical protein L873DRAFT_830470 [Choiromyces venosus 120613-1]